MQPAHVTSDLEAANALVDFAGAREWKERLAEIGCRAGAGPRVGRIRLQRHAIECLIERLRRPGRNQPLTDAEGEVARLAAEAVRLIDALTPSGRDALRARLRAALVGEGTLVPVFHLLRTARLQRARGFEVGHAGLDEAAPFDLLLRRGGVEAELACDVMSAEDGRSVHRGAWCRLVDRVDPGLQAWLAAHPGRYLLKMTLPNGLKDALAAGEAGGDPLVELHRRIFGLLEQRRRADHDEVAVLRLDPLLLAAPRPTEPGLVPCLRREFGPEAHISVTTAGAGVFVMAARGGQENHVAAAMRQRLRDMAPARLTGARPGILAMFIEDTDRGEWRKLRDQLELEGEARQFLTCPEARSVVAVTCVSRMEMFGVPGPDAAAEGELRFRNPAHPAARDSALAPAVLSTV